MGLFSKFAFSFGLNKKNKYLPEGTINENYTKIADEVVPVYPVNSYKTIASFDLEVNKPKYQGAIPDATIKFYPLN